MPSDTMSGTGAMDGALAAVARSRDAYRSAVVSAVEELEGVLAAHRSSGEDRADVLGRALGPFVAGRVDTGRLASVLARDTTLAPGAVVVMETALRVLSERATTDDALFHATVAPGGDLRDTVRDALADLGRAFGAARAVELARSGRYLPERDNELLSRFPFRRWNAGERRVAPPLVIEVQGADLRPAGLADFLEGGIRIVLVVRGAAPPAALARLVSPGVLVLQTRSIDGLEGAAGWQGPVLAALFGEDAGDVVPFVHDPRAGTLPWERIHLDDGTDAVRERFAERRWKERGWAEDLAHLLDLASAPTAVEAGTAGNPGTEERPAPSADRLAAWLLAQTDLSD